MADWKEVSAKMWDAIFSQVKNWKKEGKTNEQIAKILGAKNRTIVTLWLNGDRKAENTTFPLMMTYAEACGLDYRKFFPDSAKYDKEINKGLRLEIENLEEEIAKLKQENSNLVIFKYKWLGHIEALAAAHGDAKKAI